jgi:hypothetical protein
MTLLQEDKGMTESQLADDVWPFDTYGAFAFMLPMGLLVEQLGYRPVIAIGLGCRQATRLLLLFGGGVAQMALMQLSYAAATSATVVYVAYIYTVAPPELAPSATSCVLAAYHAGNIVGSLAGEALVAHGVPLRTLFFLSWGFTCLGAGCYFVLPAGRFPPPAPSLCSLLRAEGPAALRAELRSLYALPPVRLWAAWWLLGYSALNLLGNYFQLRLSDIDPHAGFGLAEAAVEVAACLGALAPSLLRLPASTLPPGRSSSASPARRSRSASVSRSRPATSPPRSRSMPSRTERSLSPAGERLDRSRRGAAAGAASVRARLHRQHLPRAGAGHRSAARRVAAPPRAPTTPSWRACRHCSR